MIEVLDVSKSYRIFRKGRWRVFDALGLAVPRDSYEEFWALRDVSLVVPRGQRLGIIGRNGAGKSTLVKIVAGLAQPTRGAVRVSGQVQTLMELGTGFHPEFSGRDNVLATLAYQGVTGPAGRARLEEVVEFSELGEFIDRPLKSYSAGMQARLAFSVATAMVPDILVIDEVLSAGDAYFAGKCLARMRRLTMESGATVLFVSHDLQAVQAMCDRAIWLHRGCVQADGEPLHVLKAYVKQVQDDENLRLSAGGRPAHRMTPGELQERVPLRFAFGEGAVTECRLFFKLEGYAAQEVVAIEGVDIRDRNLNLVARLASRSSGAGEALIVGPSEKSNGRDQRLRPGPGVHFVRQGDLDGLQFRAPISLNDLLTRHHLVLRALPARRSKVQVLFEYKGTVACIGEILPERTPHWREYRFGFDILFNLDEISEDTEKRVLRRSAVTGKYADPQIENVRFLNSKGEAVTGIEERNDLTVAIDYYSSQPVRQPVFGLSIYLPEGTALCRAVSRFAGLEIERLYGRGTVQFVFSPFYGGPGEYIVSVSIFAHFTLMAEMGSEVFDRHDRAYRFRVWKDFRSLSDPALVCHPYTVTHTLSSASGIMHPPTT